MQYVQSNPVLFCVISVVYYVYWLYEQENSYNIQYFLV